MSTHATHQNSVIALVNDFHTHDATALSQLSDSALDAQVDARQCFYDYIDDMWQAAKRAGDRPADNQSEWNSVAALRDLAMTLWSDAGAEQNRRSSK